MTDHGRWLSRDKLTETLHMISLVAFSVASLAILVLTITDRIVLTSTAEIVAIGVALGITYTIGILGITRRIRRIRLYKFRVAITGRPNAGKTVFSVLVFDAMMNNTIPDASFSAESKSLISVYQAIRNLPAGIWPRSTAKGNISTYEGTIETKRSKVDLEVGDSAGEYWLDLSDETGRDPGYLEYVLSAEAIAHVIPADEVVKDGDRVRLTAEVDDLLLVSRLKRQARGPRRPDGLLSRSTPPANHGLPLLIVVSKMDLVINEESLRRDELSRDLFRVVGASNLSEMRILSGVRVKPMSRSGIVVTMDRWLRDLSDSLSRDFSSVHFCFSSAAFVSGNSLRRKTGAGDIVQWILAEAESGERASR